MKVNKTQLCRWFWILQLLLLLNMKTSRVAYLSFRPSRVEKMTWSGAKTAHIRSCYVVLTPQTLNLIRCTDGYATSLGFFSSWKTPKTHKTVCMVLSSRQNYRWESQNNTSYDAVTTHCTWLQMILQWSDSAKCDTLQNNHLKYQNVCDGTAEKRRKNSRKKPKNKCFIHCIGVSLSQNLKAQMKKCVETLTECIF